MSTAERPPAAKDRAYAYVKERILEGAYPGGELLSEGEVIRPGVLPSSIQVPVESEIPEIGPAPALVEGASLDDMVGSYEKTILAEALKCTHGNIAAASRLLFSTPRIVSYKVKQYGLAT